MGDWVGCMFVKKLIVRPRFHARTLETQPHALDLKDWKAHNVIRILFLTLIVKTHFLLQNAKI